MDLINMLLQGAAPQDPNAIVVNGSTNQPPQQSPITGQTPSVPPMRMIPGANMVTPQGQQPDNYLPNTSNLPRPQGNLFQRIVGALIDAPYRGTGRPGPVEQALQRNTIANAMANFDPAHPEQTWARIAGVDPVMAQQLEENHNNTQAAQMWRTMQAQNTAQTQIGNIVHHFMSDPGTDDEAKAKVWSGGLRDKLIGMAQRAGLLKDQDGKPIASEDFLPSDYDKTAISAYGDVGYAAKDQDKNANQANHWDDQAQHWATMDNNKKAQIAATLQAATIKAGAQTGAASIRAAAALKAAGLAHSDKESQQILDAYKINGQFPWVHAPVPGQPQGGQPAPQSAPAPTIAPTHNYVKTGRDASGRPVGMTPDGRIEYIQ